MSVNLQRKEILVCEMKDGQVAEITFWGESLYPFKRIVQRFDDKLVIIGEPSECGWQSIPNDDEYRVRLLEPGEAIVITSN